MAESLRERLENVTECIVCFERFSTNIEPKVLFCGHQVCRICLEGILEAEGLNTAIECPECRRVTQLPLGGVTKLITSFSTLAMAETLEETTSNLPDVSPRNCQDCGQPNDGRRNFCESCQVQLCLACYSENHSSHHMLPMEKDFQELCRTLSQKRATVEEEIMKESNKRARVEECEELVEKNRQDVQQKIRYGAQKCMELVKSWEKMLLADVAERCQKQHEELRNAKKEIQKKREKMEEDLKNSQSFCREILNNNDKETVLREWGEDLPQMVDNIIEYSEDTETTVPITSEADLVYRSHENCLKSEFCKFGELFPRCVKVTPPGREHMAALVKRSAQSLAEIATAAATVTAELGTVYAAAKAQAQDTAEEQEVQTKAKAAAETPEAVELAKVKESAAATAAVAAAVQAKAKAAAETAAETPEAVELAEAAEEVAELAAATAAAAVKVASVLAATETSPQPLPQAQPSPSPDVEEVADEAVETFKSLMDAAAELRIKTFTAAEQSAAEVQKCFNDNSEGEDEEETEQYLEAAEVVAANVATTAAGATAAAVLGYSIIQSELLEVIEFEPKENYPKMAAWLVEVAAAVVTQTEAAVAAAEAIGCRHRRIKTNSSSRRSSSTSSSSSTQGVETPDSEEANENSAEAVISSRNSTQDVPQGAEVAATDSAH